MATVTKTLKTSGGDYSSIETWNSTESTNLVTDGDEHVLEISEGTFLTVDSGLVLSGWTTGASNRLTIKAASGEELLPVVESQGTSNVDVVFNLDTPYITLQDIIARHSTTYNSFGRTVNAPTQDDGVIVQRLIIDGGPRALTISGYNTSVTVTSIIRNCEVHGGAYNFVAFEQIILQNVTFTDTAIINIRDQPRSASTKIQNVFAPDWSYTNPGSYGTISNNAATDTSAPGTSAVNSVVTGDAFTDYTGGDYTVKDTGSDLYDAGADLSGSFTDDILGNTRSTWDIGAYEYVASGTDVSVNVEALTLTTYSATIEYTGADTNVSVGTAALTITEYPATVSLDANVAANTEALTLTTYAATLSLDKTVDVNTSALTLTTYPASLSADNDISVGTVSFTLTTNPADVVFDVEVSVGTEALSLTTYPATINYGIAINAGVASLTLTEYPATLIYDVEVTAGPEALTLTTHQATVLKDTDVSTGVAALTLTTYPATVAANDVNVGVGTEALTLTTYPASISFDKDVTTGTVALTLTTYQASITAAVKSVTCTLVTRTGDARPNLSSLSWAWFDSQDPATFGAPTDQGETEVTDGTGLIEIEIPSSTLTTGQVGTLVLRADDGSAYGAYNLTVQ